jgi:hypothetical protein
MYEKENRDQEILDLLLALNGKVQMLLDDMDDLRETVAQLKFYIEDAEEEKMELLQASGNTNWKKETL